MNSTETNTETVNPCQREVSVEVPAEIVSQQWQSSLTKLQKFARIPGFRRGKVPATILRQRFADDIKSEIIEHLVPKYFREEASKQNLTPISQPQVTELHLEEGDPLRFKATFEVLPQFDITGYKDVKVEKETVTVTDEEVEKSLDGYREQSASYDPVEEDRGLVDGDHAQISFKSTSPEEGAQPIEMNDVLVDIGGSNTVKEFSENLRGAKVNEERSFDVSYPEDFADNRLAGKSLHYEVKVTAIKKKVLPELNDDFAKQIGEDGLNTIDDVRKRIREGMEHGAQHEAEHKAKDKLVEELVKKFDFPVPSSMVEHQIDTRLERGLRALAQQGMRTEDMRRMDMSRLREGQREAALREVKASLLLEKIADAENVQVTDEELDGQINALAVQSRQTPDAIKARMQETGAVERMRDSMRTEKALDLLYKQS